jgi:hypothetical protein
MVQISCDPVIARDDSPAAGGRVKLQSAGKVRVSPRSSCSAMPPHRTQRTRESRADVDMTIPHEHSITGMEILRNNPGLSFFGC